jgi:hypothetical protein
MTKTEDQPTAVSIRNGLVCLAVDGDADTLYLSWTAEQARNIAADLVRCAGLLDAERKAVVS